MGEQGALLEKIIKFFLVRYDSHKEIHISSLESLFSSSITRTELCSMLQSSDHFFVYETEDDVTISINLQDNDFHILSQIKLWRDNLASLLHKPTLLSAIGSVIRRPTGLDGIKLKDVILFDPLNRFYISGEGNDTNVVRKSTPDEVTAFTEKWKSAIFAFLRNIYTPVPISELGVRIPRPEQLPNSVKLLQTLQSDPKNRFQITPNGCDYLVRRVVVLTDQEKEKMQREYADSLEEWRMNIANFLILQNDAVTLSSLGGNKFRPERLPTEFRLQNTLREDPKHRFILSGKLNDVKVRLSKAARSLNSNPINPVKCDFLDSHSCGIEDDGWTEVVRRSARLNNTQRKDTSQTIQQKNYSSFLKTTLKISDAPQSGEAVAPWKEESSSNEWVPLKEPLLSEVHDPPDFFGGTSFLHHHTVEYNCSNQLPNSRARRQLDPPPGLGPPNGLIQSVLYPDIHSSLLELGKEDSDTTFHMVLSENLNTTSPGPYTLGSLQKPVSRQSPSSILPMAFAENVSVLNKTIWSSTGTPVSPFDQPSPLSPTHSTHSEHIKNSLNSVYEFKDSDCPLSDWFVDVFKGFDENLVASFASSLREEGFITIHDLLYAHTEGQLTLAWMGEVAGFKRGHLNRLLHALETLKTNACFNY